MRLLSLLTLCVLPAITVPVYAGNFRCVSQDVAEQTKKALDAVKYSQNGNTNIIRFYCRHCGDSGYVPKLVVDVGVQANYCSGPASFRITVDDHPIDIGNVYISQGNKWVNLAHRIGLEVDNPPELPDGLDEQPTRRRSASQVRWPKLSKEDADKAAQAISTAEGIRYFCDNCDEDQYVTIKPGKARVEKDLIDSGYKIYVDDLSGIGVRNLYFLKDNKWVDAAYFFGYSESPKYLPDGLTDAITVPTDHLLSCGFGNESYGGSAELKLHGTQIVSAAFLSANANGATCSVRSDINQLPDSYMVQRFLSGSSWTTEGDKTVIRPEEGGSYEIRKTKDGYIIDLKNIDAPKICGVSTGPPESIEIPLNSNKCTFK